MKRKIIGIVYLLCIIPLWQACTTRSRHNQISNVLENYYDDGAFNGCILVAERGSILIDTAMGMANFDTKKALTTTSSFYLASLSKQFTAMGIMLLEQQRKLSYEDPISKYVTPLPPFAQSISIRNLLNHTSGIPDYFESDTLVKPGLSNAQVLSWLNQQKGLDFKPGSKFFYSNTGYLLLSEIIKRVSQKSYPQFMKQMIFDPLQMQHTSVFDSTTPPIQNRAIGFNKNKDIDDYHILTTGDGGIFSTTHDLFKWDQALYNDTLLSPTALADAFRKPKLSNGNFSDYGFGWDIKEDESGRAVFHTGELNGYQTFIYRDIGKHNTIILLSNQGTALQMWPIANEILSILSKPHLQ